MKHKIHIGNEIKKELNTQKRSVNWLADEIGHDQSNLRKKLEKPCINTNLLHSISVALGKDYFVVFTSSLSKVLPNKR